MLQKLLKSEVLVLSVTKHLRREKEDAARNVLRSNQETGLEIKNLETVLRHQYSLKGLPRKRGGKILGKRQRKARAKERKVH